MYGLCTIIFALLLQPRCALPLSLVLTFFAGALLGLANGLLAILLSLPAIIITLGTLSVYRGVAWWLSDGFPVSNFELSSAFFEFGQRHLIPWPKGLDWSHSGGAPRRRMHPSANELSSHAVLILFSRPSTTVTSNAHGIFLTGFYNRELGRSFLRRPLPHQRNS
jgi:ABC-type xylose transport system permease subunit